VARSAAPTATSDGLIDPSVGEAIANWFFWIFLISAFFTVVPNLVIPWAHDHSPRLDISFGKGEIFPVAFAVFAAAASRWNTKDAPGAFILRGLSVVLLLGAAIGIALTWGDGYQALINTPLGRDPDPKRVVGADTIVTISWYVLGVAFIFGLVTEWLHAVGRSRKT